MASRVGRGLPVELVDEIAYLVWTDSTPDTVAFGLACRLFYDVACSYLWQRLDYDFCSRNEDEGKSSRQIRLLMNTARLHRFVGTVSVTIRSPLVSTLQESLKHLARLIPRCDKLYSFSIHADSCGLPVHLSTALVAALGECTQLRWLTFSFVSMSARWPSHFGMRNRLEGLRMSGKVGKLARVLQYQSPQEIYADEDACGDIGRHCRLPVLGLARMTRFSFELRGKTPSAGDQKCCDEVLKALDRCSELVDLYLKVKSRSQLGRFSEVCCPQIRHLVLDFGMLMSWLGHLDVLGRAFPRVLALTVNTWQMRGSLGEHLLSVAASFPNALTIDFNVSGSSNSFKLAKLSDEDLREIEQQVRHVFETCHGVWALRYRHDADIIATFCLEGAEETLHSALRLLPLAGRPSIRLIDSAPLDTLRRRLHPSVPLSYHHQEP